ncbi:MAG: tyrosine-type recombinase/integrase [Bdellovibrionaceae bacterium]|nr:tyrosine-type recombinase/integrase [Pseudobdellovibrionaceae bacterium]MDW8189598.1 tyrosine-type recombinase/integrase [Pseudobdellovibrionaceae bacterium]
MLPYWVEFFEDLQLVRGRSPNTVQAYRRDLEVYEKFLEQKRPLNEIFAYLQTLKLSVRSQARIISSIRTYLKFCYQKGLKIPNLSELRPPKIKTTLPKVLTFSEFERLYQASTSPNAIRSHRNHMVLWLLYGLGCRVSELIQLNLNDYFATEGVFKITGKAQKERLVPIPSLLIPKIHVYLENIRPQLLKSKFEQSFVINDRGHRPSRVDVWRWLHRWSKDAGFSETINPHRFRHGFATSLLQNGADLRSIQLLLGHSSIQTTQIYTHLTQNHLVRELDTHHPLSKLNESE